MYGATRAEVESKLVDVRWLPTVSNQIIKISSVNGINKKIERISKELERLPIDIQKYAYPIGGTFNYRNIANTTRKSPHSYGIAIDLNVDFTDSWEWNNEEANKKLVYKNRIPIEIVEIFEKYGFIWGGKWYHFDTAHFEYRPELLSQ